MEEKVRTRFAPSPTGFLHLGGARTAIFNWAFARKTKGTFVLRIEDTDPFRSREEFVQAICEDLAWLGVDWDEGPDKGGPFGPYRQSERGAIYEEFLRKLQREGYVYPCYCTAEELEKEREEALEEGRPPRYSRRCLFLTPEERRALEREGRKPSWRFRVPSGRTVTVEDLVRGRVSFTTDALTDVVLVRSDGLPTYNFACVVDDALMRITHVLRGEEHLPNTPYQVLLYEALGFFPSPFRSCSHHSLPGWGKAEQAIWRRKSSLFPGRGFSRGGALQLPPDPWAFLPRGERNFPPGGTRRAF